MAITNASTLAEYASGISTQGATLTVDANNKRVGIGTTNPLAMLQVGTGVTVFGNAGIASFTSLKLSGETDSTSTTTGALTVTGGVGIGLSLTVGGDVSIGGTITYEDVTNVDSLGIVTARSGLRVVGGGVTCVGVATFFSDIDANGALDVDGQTDLDVLNVAEIATFAADVSIADKIIHTGDTDTAIRFSAADTVTVETAGTDQLNISTGGVGIADKLLHLSDANTSIRFPANNTITAETGGSERMRITSAGFVGIGSAVPNDPGGSGHCVDIMGGSSGTAIYLRTNTGSIGQINFATSDLTIRTRQATPILFNVNNSEKLRIGTSGEIGIGGATYGSSGQVLTSGGSGSAVSWATPAVTAFASGANTRIITATSSSAITGSSSFTWDGDQMSVYAGTDDTNATLLLVGKTASGGVGQAGRTAIIAESTNNSNGQSAMHFRTRNTSNAEKIAMTIDGDQKVGIGTNSPLNTLHINGQTSGVGPILQMSNNTGDCRLFFGTHSTTADANAQGQIRYNVANDYLAAYTSGDERLRINTDGHIKIGSGSATGIHNLAKVLEISGGDGGDLIIGNDASSNIGAGAHIGAIAFKNIDNSTGSSPHYAGIRCEAVDTAGNMDLRFYTGIANLEADTPQITMYDSNLGIGTVTPGALLHTYHATSNTCATFESGDAGAGINLKDTDARSSIEQNGVSLKISSDTGAEKASSDIRMQVDGETKLKIDSTGVTALQNCTDQTFKFQVDDSWGVWNTNTGLAPNSTRTWTITQSTYGHGTFRFGGGDGNYQRAACVIEVGGLMWSTAQVYYYEEVMKHSSGASLSITYNTDNIVISLTSSSNWFYYSATYTQARRNGSVWATVTQG